MPGDESSVETIVPCVKVALPGGGKADFELSEDDSPVEAPFVADLIILYGFDEPAYFTIVNLREFRRLGLDHDSIHRHALENLRRLIPAPEVSQVFEGVYMLTCGGNFESATLLLDEIWEQTQQMVENDLIVAVPARDIVLFTGSENIDGLAFIRSKVSIILETGDHILTRHFLRRNGNQWQKYTGHAD